MNTRNVTLVWQRLEVYMGVLFYKGFNLQGFVWGKTEIAVTAEIVIFWQ